MNSRPHMIVGIARHLEDQTREQGHDDRETRSGIVISLNRRDLHFLVDPEADPYDKCTKTLGAVGIGTLGGGRRRLVG